MHSTLKTLHVKKLALLLLVTTVAWTVASAPATENTGSERVGSDKVKPKEVVETAVGGEDGVQRASLVAKRGGYFFTPDRIILKQGVKTELTFFQKGWAFRHHIVMDSPGAGMKFLKYMTGEPRVIVFTPTRTGEFPVWCDAKIFWLFGSHRERGMEAIIEVIK